MRAWLDGAPALTVHGVPVVGARTALIINGRTDWRAACRHWGRMGSGQAPPLSDERQPHGDARKRPAPAATGFGEE